MHKDRFVSRMTLCKQLHIGEGAVKTLILHMKAQKIVDTTRAGTYLTEKGKRFAIAIMSDIPDERIIKKSTICSGKYNHSILIKGQAKIIKTGIEQRDFAILYGASIALTLIYQDGRFSFPGEQKDALVKDKKVLAELMSMNPKENDVVIITSASDPFVAEVAAKNSALCTVSD